MGWGFAWANRQRPHRLRADPAAGATPLAAEAPQIARPGGWKDCSYNDVVIGCIDRQLPQGLRVDWKDGLYIVYLETAAPGTGKTPLLRDSLGALWRR